MNYGSSPVEDSRPFADTAFRPGKGSRPRPITSIKALHRNLERIFKWSYKKRLRKQLARRPFPGIIP